MPSPAIARSLEAPVTARKPPVALQPYDGLEPNRHPRPRHFGAWAAVVIFGLFALLPIAWLLKTSFTPTTEVFTYPPQYVPSHLTLEHYTSFFADPVLLGFLKNSVIVSAITAILSLVVSMYMGYAFSKFRFRGRRALMYFVLSSQMFPSALLLVTLYVVFSKLAPGAGLSGTFTYVKLIVSYTTFTLPLCVWMLKGFFDTLPNELIEAAKVDGASRWRTFHSIVLPLAAPGLVAAGLFAFIKGWNDFMFALTLADPQHMTLPPGLVNKYISEAATQWPALMAASFIVSIPVCVAFIALQTMLGVWNDFFTPLLYVTEKSQWTLALGITNIIQSSDATLHGRTNLLMAACTIMALFPLVLFALGQKFFMENVTFTGLTG